MRVVVEVLGVIVICFLVGILWLKNNSDETPIALPPLVFLVDEDSAYIEGTWEMVGQDGAWPDQVSAFHCLKALSLCWTATAVLADRQQLMPLDLEPIKVTAWEPNRLIAEGKSGRCNTITYSFDLGTRSATALVTPIEGGEVCVLASKLEKRLVLVNGQDRFYLRGLDR